MNGNYCDVKSEKDEKLLIVLSDTVVDPRTMVVHFSDASVEASKGYED